MSRKTNTIIAVILQAIWSIASIWYVFWNIDHGSIVLSRFLSKSFTYGTYAFYGGALNCFLAILALWGILSIFMIPGWFSPQIKTITSLITLIPFVVAFVYLMVEVFKAGLFDGGWFLDILAFLLVVFIGIVLLFATFVLALPALITRSILEFLCIDYLFEKWLSIDSHLSIVLVTLGCVLIAAFTGGLIAFVIATLAYFLEFTVSAIGLIVIFSIVFAGVGGGTTYLVILN